ncbi:hypothetical protein ZWY2020_025352 [Hordeum vulgare]|nr:hypothetical protein ZWY2020_025352 [Hordeum vulgare]
MGFRGDDSPATGDSVPVDGRWGLAPPPATAPLIGASFGRWFALRYLDSLNESVDEMFEIRLLSSGGSYWSFSRLAVKKSKAEKDPNKPKRPPSSFFIFM